MYNITIFLLADGQNTICFMLTLVLDVGVRISGIIVLK